MTATVFGAGTPTLDTPRRSFSPSTPPTPQGSSRNQADPAGSGEPVGRCAGCGGWVYSGTSCTTCGTPSTASRCGAYADHVDHVDPRHGRLDSALLPTGSTRRWRRIRAWVLNRDAYRCQVLVEAGAVIEAPRPATPPLGPDDVRWLRATCRDHNLSRGGAETDARPISNDRPTRPTTRWSW